MKKIKPRKIINHGNVRWVVDLRNVKGHGKRHFFDDKAEAEKLIAKAVPVDDAIILTGQAKREYLSMLDLLDGASPVEAAVEFKRNHGLVASVTMSEALAACIAAKRNAGKSESYLDHLEARIQSLAESVGDKTAVSKVQASDVEKWLHARSWKQVTKRGVLIDVRTFFNFCLRKNWVRNNPAMSVEQIEVGEYVKGILTPEQARIYIETAAEIDPPLLRYFSDQLFGGLREDEARHLEKKQVKEKFIELSDTKTGEVRFVEFNDTWLAWRGSKPEYAPIENCWKRIAAVKTAIKKKLGKDFEFPHNCLRHSFATYAAKMWGSGRAAELAGHSEAMQKKHYKRPVTLDEAKAFWSIRPS